MELLKHIQTLSHISAEHFAETFGVKLNQEDSFFQFKYLQLTANWDSRVTHESRGVILRCDGSEWSVASRPFDKFFNQGESHCPVFDEGEFARRASGMEFAEKADGTCIQAWHDGDRWRASTLGTITPSFVGDEPYTFDELFWKTANLGPVLDRLDKEATYVFELCADANRIVTKYETDHCVLLGIRNKKTGEYASLSSGMALTVCEGTNIRLPHRVPFTDAGIKSLDQALAFVENEKNATDIYGEWPEGFVLYEGGAPVAKMKNSRYVELHAVGGGDLKHSKNRIIEAVFNGNLDDIYPVLSDRLKEFADQIQAKAMTLVTDTMIAIRSLQKGYYPDQRAYALAVQEHLEGPWRAFAFQNKAAILGKGPGLPDLLLVEWLSKNYQKFEWKD